MAEQRRILAALDGLCNAINNQTRVGDNPDQYLYLYEKSMYLAAGVGFKSDTTTTAIAKLGRLWDENPQVFKCTSTNFSVPNGAILKYALETRSFGFIEDAMGPWHLDLNHIDPADCRTLLDFAEWKLGQNRGTHLEPVLTGYVERFKQAGAKHSSEVSSAERQAQFEQWHRNAARLRAVGAVAYDWPSRCPVNH